MASPRANAVDRADNYKRGTAVNNRGGGDNFIPKGGGKNAGTTDGGDEKKQTSVQENRIIAKPMTASGDKNADIANPPEGMIQDQRGRRPPDPQTNEARGSGSAGTTAQTGQTQGGTGAYGGVTNYGQISEQFQNWNPTSDWGKSLQATYMMNTLQSYNDMQQAQSMAFTNAGIQMDMMTAQSALELANKSALLNEEQKAALNMMGAQFDYESRFAQDEYNRQVGAATLGTDLQIQLMQAQGDQTRANYQVQGFEQRMADMERGNQDRLTQAQANVERMQQADQANELGKDAAAFQQGLEKDSAGYMQGLQKDTAQFQQALEKDSAAFGQALGKDTAGYQSGLRKDEAQFGSGLRKDEATFGSGIRKDEALFGSDIRKSELTLESDLRMKEADFGNRLEARTRADQAKRSVGRARGF